MRAHDQLHECCCVSRAVRLELLQLPCLPPLWCVTSLACFSDDPVGFQQCAEPVSSACHALHDCQWVQYLFHVALPSLLIISVVLTQYLHVKCASAVADYCFRFVEPLQQVLSVYCRCPLWCSRHRVMPCCACLCVVHRFCQRACAGWYPLGACY